jgi:uncharacterized protein
MDKGKVEVMLKKYANDLNVSILFAAEIGSRAYDVHHEQSDFDIGIIFKYENEKYLNLNRPKDAFHKRLSSTIEVQCWDIYKMCELLLKSNASLYEWLQSDIIYIDEATFISTSKEYFLPRFSKLKLAMHYYQMTKKNIQNYRRKDNSKLLYQCARCYLMLLWLVEKDTLPPIKLIDLLQQELEEQENFFLQNIYYEKMNKKQQINMDFNIFIDSLEVKLEQMIPTIKSLSNDKIKVEDINELLLGELIKG